jgi:hypothetical protein
MQCLTSMVKISVARKNRVISTTPVELEQTEKFPNDCTKIER